MDTKPMGKRASFQGSDRVRAQAAAEAARPRRPGRGTLETSGDAIHAVRGGAACST